VTSTTPNETRTYIQLIRQRYPNAVVIEQEPYPYISAAELGNWIDAMAAGPGAPDYFELDVDLNAPGRSNSDLQFLMNHTRAVGLRFGLLYAYTTSNDYGDTPFYNGTNQECNYFNDAGLNADLYHPSAFNHSPQNTSNENAAYFFMYTIKTLLNRGCIAGSAHQPPGGGGSGGVTAYEALDFSGASFSVTSDQSFVGWDWNDRVTSIRVPAGQTVTLYGDIDFGGPSLTLTSDAPDLRQFAGPGGDGTWNDAVSSIRLSGNPPPPSGRWKLGGDGSCYWDPNDSGPDQCTPPAPLMAARFRDPSLPQPLATGLFSARHAALWHSPTLVASR
jgi:hypothetical protein